MEDRAGHESSAGSEGEAEVCNLSGLQQSITHHLSSEGGRNGSRSKHKELGAGERMRGDPGRP